LLPPDHLLFYDLWSIHSPRHRSRGGWLIILSGRNSPSDFVRPCPSPASTLWSDSSMCWWREGDRLGPVVEDRLDMGGWIRDG
jgi:hypothetical protein